jgi:hypothetical protein
MVSSAVLYIPIVPLVSSPVTSVLTIPQLVAMLGKILEVAVG